MHQYTKELIRFEFQGYELIVIYHANTSKIEISTPEATIFVDQGVFRRLLHSADKIVPTMINMNNEYLNDRMLLENTKIDIKGAKGSLLVSKLVRKTILLNSLSELEEDINSIINSKD